MKQLNLTILIFVSVASGLAQPNMMNFHFGAGFQAAKAKFKITTAKSEIEGTGKCRNILLAGGGIYGNQVIHVDCTMLGIFLVNGFKTPRGSVEGGVFDCGFGTTFRNREKSRWGWSGDLVWRTVSAKKVKSDTTTLNINTYTYVGTGLSIYYLRSFGKYLFIMPKFSMAYGGLSRGTYRRASRSEIAISIGYKIKDGWGLSINMGAYGMNFTDQSDAENKLSINPSFFQIGLCKMGNSKKD